MKDEKRKFYGHSPSVEAVPRNNKNFQVFSLSIYALDDPAAMTISDAPE